MGGKGNTSCKALLAITKIFIITLSEMGTHWSALTYQLNLCVGRKAKVVAGRALGKLLL